MKILNVTYSFDTEETDINTNENVICKISALMPETEWNALKKELKTKKDFEFTVSEWERPQNTERAEE